MHNNTNTLGTSSPGWEGLRRSRRWRSTVQRICNVVRQDASIEERNNPLGLLHGRFLGCDPSQGCWGVDVEGVGGVIEGLDGRRWGQVARESDKVWTLEDGRIAKKATQHAKWRWAEARADPACTLQDGRAYTRA